MALLSGDIGREAVQLLIKGRPIHPRHNLQNVRVHNQDGFIVTDGIRSAIFYHDDWEIKDNIFQLKHPIFGGFVHSFLRVLSFVRPVSIHLPGYYYTLNGQVITDLIRNYDIGITDSGEYPIKGPFPGDPKGARGPA